MLQNVTRLRQLSSCLTVSSQVATFQVTPEQFKDHPSTHGCLTGPRNMPQEKQTEELKAPMHTRTVS